MTMRSAVTGGVLTDLGRHPRPRRIGIEGPNPCACVSLLRSSDLGVIVQQRNQLLGRGIDDAREAAHGPMSATVQVSRTPG